MKITGFHARSTAIELGLGSGQHDLVCVDVLSQSRRPPQSVGRETFPAEVRVAGAPYKKPRASQSVRVHNERTCFPQLVGSGHGKIGSNILQHVIYTRTGHRLLVYSLQIA